MAMNGFAGVPKVLSKALTGARDLLDLAEVHGIDVPSKRRRKRRVRETPVAVAKAAKVAAKVKTKKPRVTEVDDAPDLD